MWNLLGEGKKLQKMFENKGVSTGVFSVLRVKPLCNDEIKELALNSKLVITMEEHNVVGGFGGAVAEALSEIEEKHAVLISCWIAGYIYIKNRKSGFLRDYYEMNAEKVFAHVMENYEL